MTLLTERPAISSTEKTLKTAAGVSVAGTAVRGGSYVSIPAGGVYAGVEGSYVTVAGTRNMPHATRGSYDTADGTPVVAARVIEGNYVTFPTAA
ncbi:MAG: hypothetical protein ABI568_03630 [Pseudarthrobacter sp.]